MKRFVCAATIFLGYSTLQLNPVAAQTPSAVTERADDLVDFRKFVEQEKAYTPDTRARALAQLEDVQRRLQTLSPAEFELRIAQIVALADNGHTNIFPNSRAPRYNRIPLRLGVFGEDYYVLRARAGSSELLGARLVAIDNQPIAKLREAARGLTGGTTAWRDRRANFLFESPALLHGLRLSEAEDHAIYRWELPSHKIVAQTIVAEPSNPKAPAPSSSRYMYPDAVQGEADDWQPLLREQDAPWSLLEASRPFRMRDNPATNSFVIQMRQNISSDSMDIVQFELDAVDAIRASARHNLILDLRENGGGNLNLTRAFMQKLPRLVPGRIFVLTSPWTFSAAISSLGYLKQASPERVMIVGEKVGDRLRFFAEGGDVLLANSGIRIARTTERHDYLTGCKGFDDCHAPVMRNPIAVSTLAPDIEAPWTIEDYRAGRDPGMEAIKRALAM